MKKRVLALVLSICVVFSVAPEVALAEEPMEAEAIGEEENPGGEEPDFEEEVNEDTREDAEPQEEVLNAETGAELQQDVDTDLAEDHLEQLYAGEIGNPRIVRDDSMESGQNVTYDCIWFGNYPADEIEKDDPVYAELENISDWNSNYECIANGKRYRKMMERADDAWINHYYQYKPIKWRVLQVKDGKALLQTDRIIIDCKYMRESGSWNETWGQSTLREYLNERFLDAAFSLEQRAAIPIVKRLDSYGNVTQDQIFALREDEICGTGDAVSYGFVADKNVEDEARIKTGTTYANARPNYWLAGPLGEYVEDGSIVQMKMMMLRYISKGVSPVLYLDLSKKDTYSYAGTLSTKGDAEEIAAQDTIFETEGAYDTVAGSSPQLSQESFTYDGTEKQPTVTLSQKTEGVDFEVSYMNNVGVGTARVIIRGIGKYTGVCTKMFEITAAEPEPEDKTDWLYEDVPEKTGWRYEAIKYVKDHGIMNGISGTRNFAPDEPLTRAMFATIIYRMEGSPKASYSAKFPDVPDGNYFSVPIIWANKAGIINGHSNTGLFGTRENITREDMVVIMYRYCRVKGLASGGRADLSRFPDADQASGYAKEAVQWAVANGIINGRSNTGMLDPKGNASRVETVAIIQRFMTKIK